MTIIFLIFYLILIFLFFIFWGNTLDRVYEQRMKIIDSIFYNTNYKKLIDDFNKVNSDVHLWNAVIGRDPMRLYSSSINKAYHQLPDIKALIARIEKKINPVDAKVWYLFEKIPEFNQFTTAQYFEAGYRDEIEEYLSKKG